MKDFDMIKAVAADLSEIGLTQNKELSICLAIDYMASTNIASPFDYSTKFSRIVNPMWATDMYTTHGQDAKVKHYLQPHFMDGYIKKDDCIYITTGYLQSDKTLLDPYDEDSSDEEDYVPHEITPALHQWRHFKYRVNFLVGRQLKQLVDIITMNGVHPPTTNTHAFSTSSSSKYSSPMTRLTPTPKSRRHPPSDRGFLTSVRSNLGPPCTARSRS